MSLDCETCMFMVGMIRIGPTDLTIGTVGGQDSQTEVPTGEDLVCNIFGLC